MLGCVHGLLVHLVDLLADLCDLVSAGHDEREGGRRRGKKKKRFAILYIQTPDQPPTRPDVIYD